jgi:hypothetical protein
MPASPRSCADRAVGRANCTRERHATDVANRTIGTPGGERHWCVDEAQRRLGAAAGPLPGPVPAQRPCSLSAGETAVI